MLFCLGSQNQRVATFVVKDSGLFSWKLSLAIGSSCWERTHVCDFKEVAGRQADNYTSHYTHTHTPLHTLTFSAHIIIKSTIWLTHGFSCIASPAQMLLHHKSVVKTSVCVAAPLVTWLALTFSIKYLPPRPTVAFSSAANQTQMDIYNWQQMERTSHTAPSLNAVASSMVTRL